MQITHATTPNFICNVNDINRNHNDNNKNSEPRTVQSKLH